MTKKRIWLDTVVLSEMHSAFDALENALAFLPNTQLVIANTMLDVKAFQENPTWVKEMLQKGELVIEIWATPDEMTAKDFYWSSIGAETKAASSFEEAMKALPEAEAEAIKNLVALLDEYGIPKGEWKAGAWSKPEPLSEEAQEALGLTEAATRTEVLNACQEADRMDLFNEYNAGYNRGLATQHMCSAILNIDGSITEL